MTHDDDIPELLNRLEGRLDSPSADAIRTEASRRRAVRRRTLNTAGVLALIVAIAGGALWFTRDTATTTATVAEPADSLGPADQPAVADDSAPVSASPVSLLRDLGPLSIVTDFRQEANAAFLPRHESASISFVSPRSGSTTGGIRPWVWFTNGCHADAYLIDWADTGFTTGDQVDLPPEVGVVREARCLSLSVQPVLKSPITSGQFVSVTYDPSTNRFVLQSNGASALEEAQPTMEPWSLSLLAPRWLEQLPDPSPPATGPASSNTQGVVTIDPKCINATHLRIQDGGLPIIDLPPAEWQGRGSFNVEVELDAAGNFVATDTMGLSAMFRGNPEEAPLRGCQYWDIFFPKEDLPTVDARSVDDCIAGFHATADVSTIISGLEENETAWASFQSADDWEGRTDVCWIAVSTDTGCRSYAWFRTLGSEPGKFQKEPPLDANEPCVGDGKQFG